jgi:hypothetical protein
VVGIKNKNNTGEGLHFPQLLMVRDGVVRSTNNQAPPTQVLREVQ